MKNPHPLYLLVACCVSLIGSNLFGEKVLRENIPYLRNGLPIQTLTVFRPENAETLLPAVVMYHGGSWKKGTPGQLAQLGNYLAERGIVLVSAGYRLVGNQTEDVGDCVKDAIVAYDWVCRNAESIGVDPDRIAVGGASAGGQLGLSVALLSDSAFGEIAGSERQAPLAYLGLNPVVDTNDPRFLKTFEEYGDDFNPVALLEGGAHLPPTFIAHGQKDAVVRLNTVERFAEIATDQGDEVEIMIFEGQPHGFFNPRKGREEMLNELYVAVFGFLSESFDSAGS